MNFKQLLIKLKNDTYLSHINFKYLKKVRCEVCASQKNKIIQSYGRVNANYKYGFLPVSICCDCGFVFLNPRLSNSYYKKYYKKNYRNKKFNNMLLNKEYEKQQIERGEKVYDYFSKKIKFRYKKILDHGCANGLTMLKWKRNDWKCIGIDPHLPSVQKGVRKFGLEIKNLDGENLDKLNQKFGVVLSLGSLEHSYDLNKSLKNIKRSLLKDEYLIIRWRSDKMNGSPLEYFNHNHFRYFNRETWKSVLNKHQFNIEKFIKTPVEGSDMYEYIIARKCSKKIIFNKKSRKNYKNYIMKYEKYVKKYYSLANKIKKLNIKEYKNKKYFIKKNKIGLLSINKTKAINRFFIETSKFLKFVEKI